MVTCRLTKSTEESKINDLIYCCRVLVFKEPPVLVNEDVTQCIGRPRELEKNLEDPSYFNNKSVDLTIRASSQAITKAKEQE